MKEIYEKLGLFYMGKKAGSSIDEGLLTLIKNKNLTTHAAIIGMTGSGKTGLGVGLIEEAALDNIPSIIIDPKGDMGNLMLTDPEFSPKSFEPWVEGEARSKDIEPSVYAQTTAKTWKEGIESWGQDQQRVERFHSVKKSIYTPRSDAGIPVNILSSLEVPTDAVMQDMDLFATYLKSTTASILSLVGLKEGAGQSKENTLLSQILAHSWYAGKDLDIATLIAKIIEPDFDKVGVLDLEDFYPKKNRFDLATKFNSLLADPAFLMWMQGEALDIQRLLFDEEGKAKIAIFSLSHLNDNERMFFVTILLNRYIAWMRQQSGTGSLRALLYMDEIFGYFPPTKNPPSKEPMLLMLKQARAFGIGVVLSTQNPVDIDYKGLSNIGTWFVGRLQTSQDIDRVIDGLSGKVGSGFSKSEIKEMLLNLQKRNFLLKSAHRESLELFETRWVLSYLKGPMKLEDIKLSMQGQKGTIQRATPKAIDFSSIQTIDSSIIQRFEPPVLSKQYRPIICAKAEVRFFNQAKAIDQTIEHSYELMVDEVASYADWKEAEVLSFNYERFPQEPVDGATFGKLPDFIASDKALKGLSRELKEHLYSTQTLSYYKSKSPRMESAIGEEIGDFKARITLALDEKKEQEIEKIKERFEKREKTLQQRLKRAQERVEKEKSDTTSSMVEAGIAVLGALFGRSSISKIGRAVSKGGKILSEKKALSAAQERVEECLSEIEDLNVDFEDKVDQIEQKYSIDDVVITKHSVRPRKGDIDIKECLIVWRAV